jgi:2-succinyl-5-enolpyruvyl-6-hydroxy-3-cyclohexene-1-carboxylate synthase
MKFSSKPLSQTITQLCLAKEIDHVVISPGSRNAPLTIGFTEHPQFKNFSVVDERSAAFFALGLAQQLKRPVALVCTSGSALLNYYPAVAEAFYSDIPLVILSADRPADLIDRGDGQTIRQENVFANHILYSSNCREEDTAQLHNETVINIALNTAIELNGPVHINLPFAEPLYNKVEDLTVRPQNVPPRQDALDKAIDYKTLATTWNQAGRKMVLAGVMDPNSLAESSLSALAADGSVLVFTETTSNLHHPSFFPAIDQLIFKLSDEEFEQLQPDLLITFGGMVVSKRIKAFLRKFPPKTHWHIDRKKAYDTYFALDKHLKTTPAEFLKGLAPYINPITNDYRHDWEKVKWHRLERHQRYLEGLPFSDFLAYSRIIAALPDNIKLQLANSAAIRYAQLFNIKSSIRVFCNRGTSGIDGSSSTAIGAAVAYSGQTVLVTGDLSFFYDSNALWNNYIPNGFRIILINNGGGGIFRILPHARNSAEFETYFETRHNLSAHALCQLYQIDYHRAETRQELDTQLQHFFDQGDRPALLEVFTPAELNDKVLMDYFEFIR